MASLRPAFRNTNLNYKASNCRLIDGKYLEGTDLGLVEVLSRYLPGGEPRKMPFRIAGVSQYLQGTSPERYCHTHLLDEYSNSNKKFWEELTAYFAYTTY
jgi:hypothetical protein